jgi:hypothetical protein
MTGVADIKQISGKVYIQFLPIGSYVVKMRYCGKGSGVGDSVCIRVQLLSVISVSNHGELTLE